jgi:phosphoribosylanthranilate isomerase
MTKIKICGIKTVKDALAAMEAGADLIGFNFYPKSPRYIDVGTCRNIMSVMRKHGHVTYVGVFVNASVEEVYATIETCGLTLPSYMVMRRLKCCVHLMESIQSLSWNP